jgi:hypothetical protein|tara:strand:+ start:567 stop:1088 length:522 start_codon:yes stop_codon:yes gene_type:complete
MLFLASFSTPLIGSETEFVNTSIECRREIPESMRQYSEYYLEFFDFENIDTAVRIGWCESRGKDTAYRDDNSDSGVMQFVPWTWNWVAEEYDLPRWNEWVILRYGRPYEGPTSKSNMGFEQTKVQFTPYYNIMFASILAEDIYGRTQWRDWNSSKWCWEDEKDWERRWKREQN